MTPGIAAGATLLFTALILYVHARVTGDPVIDIMGVLFALAGYAAITLGVAP